MATKIGYFEDSYKFSASCRILASSQDEHGSYLTLAETIFYPQGGGQPSDSGSVIVEGVQIAIHAVRWAGDEVRHYTDKEYSSFVGLEAEAFVDEERRVQHSTLHTAGHLLAHVVEALYPSWRACKGHHYMDGAYVEFVCDTPSTPSIDLEQVNGAIAQAVAEDLPIFVQNDNPSHRLVGIGSYPPQRCGGTHVKSLKELAALSATKQKQKGSQLKISYQAS
jgi:Ser-tRNA(Ala) deacylase AlaX